MGMYGKSFEFNGRSSEEFGVIIGTFGRVDDDIPMGLSRSVERGEFTKYRSRANHFGAVYEDPLEFELGLVKDICKVGGSNEAVKFSRSEVRAINAWLTSPQTPKLFHMTDFDRPELYDEYVDYFCTVSSVEAFASQEVLALKFVMTCDSPFGYSKEIVHTVSSTNTKVSELVIDNRSDELNDYLYPLIEIYPNKTGTVKIENVTDDNAMTLEVLRDDMVTIDCQKLKIYDSTKKLITFDDLGVKDIGDIYWFRLCSGLNQIRITGNADVTIKYREPRKVGAY